MTDKAKLAPKYESKEHNYLLRAANPKDAIELAVLAEARRVVHIVYGDKAWIVMNKRGLRVHTVPRRTVNTLINRGLALDADGVLGLTAEGKRCLRGALNKFMTITRAYTLRDFDHRKVQVAGLI